MPHIAKRKQTGERIDITRIENPRATLKSDDLICPACDWPMAIRSGLVVKPYFAHKSGRDDCPYVEYERSMTPEHRAAQEMLRDSLASWFSEYISATAELEVMITETVHKQNRIADVLFTFPSGWRVAHEVQFAGITTGTLQERTEDYRNAGVDVFWWFGKEANTATNREWSYSTYGFCLTVQTEYAGRIDTILGEQPF